MMIPGHLRSGTLFRCDEDLGRGSDLVLNGYRKGLRIHLLRVRSVALAGVGGALNLPIARILVVGTGGSGEAGICASLVKGTSRRHRGMRRASVFILFLRVADVPKIMV
jgi:hypothetical protein